MNPIHFKIPRLVGESIRVENWDMQYFYNPIHYHEECQMTYIIEGEGILFVGPTSGKFKPGDVFLFGKNLPHVLRCNEEYHRKNSSLHARAISVFFSADTLTAIFKNIPESYALEKLLSYTSFGIKVNPPLNKEIFTSMKKLLTLKGFDRMIEFLQVFNKVAQSPDLKFISLDSIPLHSVAENVQSINKVYNYIIANSREKISLAKAAALVNLSSSAFCRFFKMRTRKTFSRFLIEVRIGDACKLLAEGKYNTTECCYICGYNNISNFHRHFKAITGMTTTEYKKNLGGKTLNTDTFIPESQPEIMAVGLSENKLVK
ncbi:MAG TPA: AraC family transcriptional regulator [Chitinophagaceae bacterium]|nr:AraC family transcriptional regulator [Chitinophagaceae bacterium]